VVVGTALPVPREGRVIDGARAGRDTQPPQGGVEVRTEIGGRGSGGRGVGAHHESRALGQLVEAVDDEVPEPPGDAMAFHRPADRASHDEAGPGAPVVGEGVDGQQPTAGLPTTTHDASEVVGAADPGRARQHGRRRLR
jgi:hypothetical protein